VGSQAIFFFVRDTSKVTITEWSLLDIWHLSIFGICSFDLRTYRLHTLMEVLICAYRYLVDGCWLIFQQIYINTMSFQCSGSEQNS